MLRGRRSESLVTPRHTVGMQRLALQRKFTLQRPESGLQQPGHLPNGAGSKYSSTPIPRRTFAILEKSWSLSSWTVVETRTACQEDTNCGPWVVNIA